MIVGISGTIGAGETTACEILEKKGFKKISLSDILREKLKEEGKEINRQNLRALGEKLRSEKGMDVLARMALENTEGDIVIDSVFTKEEANYIQSKGGIIIGVVAPIELRYERVLKRDGEISWEEFQKKDEWDRKGRTDVVLEEADFIIVNDGSMEEFEEALEKAISSARAQTQ